MSMINNDSAKPLLRQIDAMRDKQLQAIQDWDRIEKQFNFRIAELEKEKIQAVEQNSMSQGKVNELVLIVINCICRLIASPL
jgi:hypothetical protein